MSGGRPSWLGWGAVVALGAAVAAGGCGLLGRGGRPAAAPAADVRLTLYRDGAFVEETVVLEVAAGATTARLPRPLGVDAAAIAIDSPDVKVKSWTAPDAGAAPVPAVTVDEGGAVHVAAATAVRAAAAEPALTVELDAARAGRARLTVRYLTDRVSWRASYTLIDDGGRGRIHGALALTNRTGRRWDRARFAVVDRNRPSAAPVATASASPGVPVPGLYAVRPGAQQLDLALGGGALALRPTLVYDPVGPRLDSAVMRPQMEERYGVEPWPATVDESVLIDLSRVAGGPLPSGPVRVFTVGDGGALVWRGEGRLLPPADDAELYTTVAVGRSLEVTGGRRRTDFAIDHDAMRLVEEITVTLHNAGARAADVLVREHLYRGQCWTLAYHSTGARIAKEGAQQIGLGVTVAAGGDATVMYRVLYEWDDRTCRLSTSSN